MERKKKTGAKQAETAAADPNLTALFPNVASQFRGALSTLYLAARQLAPPEAREQSDEADAKAAFMDQSYYRLLHMVHNLDDAAYLLGKRLYYKSFLDIVNPIGRICGQAGDLAAMKGITLKFTCPMDRHICLHDPKAIKTALYQLLSNAVKFTDDGGTISVNLRLKDGSIDLSVADTGCGISEELLPTLFDRYCHTSRMDPPRHGLGLGLSICRSIAEGHGGVVLAESRPGKGSTFTLSIPDIQSEGGILQFHEPPAEYLGGFNPLLLALADSLPREAFLLRSEE